MSSSTALQAPFFTASGEAKGTVELPSGLFQGESSRYVLHEALIALRRNQRRGTSATKTRGEVSGGGRKPWKQKGTGNARAGSNRSPLWRKGGIIFGPHPRSYRMDLNVQKKNLALLTGLIEKARASEVAVIESFPEGDGKTREAEQRLEKTGLTGRVLLVVDRKSAPVLRAIRNISRLQVADAQELNVGQLTMAQKLLFTQPALQALAGRISKS